MGSVISDIIWGGLCIFLDGIFTIVEALIASISIGSLGTVTLAQWASLPPQLVWMITQLGLADALAITGSAYGIRFLLNLIPASLTRI